jgi:hypothetical protein
MESTQYNTECIMPPVLCIAYLILATDAVCCLVMIVYVGAVYVWKMDSSGTVNVFCQFYLTMYEI